MKGLLHVVLVVMTLAHLATTQTLADKLEAAKAARANIEACINETGPWVESKNMGFVPAATAVLDAKEAFCETKFTAKTAMVNGLSVVYRPPQIQGVRISYSNGDQSLWYGTEDRASDAVYKNATWESGKVTIKSLVMWPTSNGKGLGRIEMQFTDGQVIDNGIDTTGIQPTQVDVQSGVILGVIGKFGVSIDQLGFRFLESKVAKATVTDIKFDETVEQMIQKNEGITEEQLDYRSFANYGPEDAVFKWSVEAARSERSEFNSSTSQINGGSWSVGVSASIPVPKVDLSASFSKGAYWENTESDERSMMTQNNRTYKWTYSGVVPANSVVNCKAVTYEGKFSSHYTSTVVLQLENGKTYKFPDGGNLVQDQFTNGTTTCETKDGTKIDGTTVDGDSDGTKGKSGETTDVTGDRPEDGDNKKAISSESSQKTTKTHTTHHGKEATITVTESSVSSSATTSHQRTVTVTTTDKAEHSEHDTTKSSTTHSSHHSKHTHTTSREDSSEESSSIIKHHSHHGHESTPTSRYGKYDTSEGWHRYRPTDFAVNRDGSEEGPSAIRHHGHHTDESTPTSRHGEYDTSEGWHRYRPTDMAVNRDGSDESPSSTSHYRHHGDNASKTRPHHGPTNTADDTNESKDRSTQNNRSHDAEPTVTVTVTAPNKDKTQDGPSETRQFSEKEPASTAKGQEADAAGTSSTSRTIGDSSTTAHSSTSVLDTTLASQHTATTSTSTSRADSIGESKTAKPTHTEPKDTSAGHGKGQGKHGGT